MGEMWVVIDVGCYECGVDSVAIGAFTTEEAAKAAAEARDEITGCWRDGGQTNARVFWLPSPFGADEAADNAAQGSRDV